MITREEIANVLVQLVYEWTATRSAMPKHVFDELRPGRPERARAPRACSALPESFARPSGRQRWCRTTSVPYGKDQVKARPPSTLTRAAICRRPRSTGVLRLLRHRTGTACRSEAERVRRRPLAATGHGGRWSSRRAAGAAGMAVSGPARSGKREDTRAASATGGMATPDAMDREAMRDQAMTCSEEQRCTSVSNGTSLAGPGCASTWSSEEVQQTVRSPDEEVRRGA